jgi:hypothetical protein
MFVYKYKWVEHSQQVVTCVKVRVIPVVSITPGRIEAQISNGPQRVQATIFVQ